MDVLQAAEIVRDEELRFIKTLERAERKYKAIAEQVRKGDGVISGDDAFLLTATRGLPREDLEDMVSIDGLSVDWERYDMLMTQHRERSRMVTINR